MALYWALFYSVWHYRLTLAGILETVFGGFFQLQLQIIKGILSSMRNIGQSENKSNPEVTGVGGINWSMLKNLIKINIKNVTNFYSEYERISLR